MATTTKKTSQSKTRAKSTAPKGRKTKTTQTAAPQGKYKIFLGIAAFLVLCTTIFAIYALSTVKVENNESKVVKTKQTVTTSKSKPAKIQNNYKYKQILENDEIDSGSGVKVTRDYEAEKNAKEAAYRKKLAEQRKKLREQKEALRLKKEKEALLRQQKRLQKLNKSNQNASNQKVLTTEQLKDNKMYILCEKYNFRTVKDAEKQKAKLAFIGKESQIISKSMGGGFVYSLSIGPYDSLKQAQKSRADIINANLAVNCKIKNN